MAREELLAQPVPVDSFARIATWAAATTEVLFDLSGRITGEGHHRLIMCGRRPYPVVSRAA